MTTPTGPSVPGQGMRDLRMRAAQMLAVQLKFAAQGRAPGIGDCVQIVDAIADVAVAMRALTEAIVPVEATLDAEGNALIDQLRGLLEQRARQDAQLRQLAQDKLNLEQRLAQQASKRESVPPPAPAPTPSERPDQLKNDEDPKPEGVVIEDDDDDDA